MHDRCRRGGAAGRRDVGLGSGPGPADPVGGPLTNVAIGNELGCQIAHAGDTQFELYPPSTVPGDCGTFVSAGAGQLYGPDFANHGATAASGLGTTHRSRR